MKRHSALFPVLAGMIAFGALPCAAQDSDKTSGGFYSIKPPDVIIPEDVPIGRYRRSFQPFDNWTLVCDENLHAQQLVCNASQTIIDASGKVVFSWSLAAAEKGEPFLILRATPDADTRFGFKLQLAGMKTPRKIAVEACDRFICMGSVEVSPLLAQAIGKGEIVSVTYRLKAGHVRQMRLPLKGLKEAVASIDSNDRSENPNAVQKPADPPRAQGKTAR